MRLIICLFMILSFVTACGKSEVKIPSDKFGEGVTIEDVVSMDDILKNSSQYDGKELVVESRIKTVCQARGCWMEVESGTLPMRISFENDSFFIPKESARKKVRIQGELKIKEISEEVARNYLKDAGRSNEEVQKLSGPQKLLTMVASGLIIFS